MTEPELNKAIASGKATMAEPDQNPDSSTKQSTPSAPAQPPASADQFIPLLTFLSNVQPYLSAAPTKAPQSLAEQIQFGYSGGKYYLYFWADNHWNTLQWPNVTSVAAGDGISVSASSGDITISSNGLNSANGTDSYSGTTPVSVTHTITHGLGRRPGLVMIGVNQLNAPVPVGSGTGGVYGYGSLIFDGDGNVLGGEAVGINFPTTSFYSYTALTDTVSAQAGNTGGSGTCSIKIQNFTATTFDIVYTASISTGGSVSWSSPTIKWGIVG